MTYPVSALSVNSLSNVANVRAATPGTGGGRADFLATIDHALERASQSQRIARSEARDVVTGSPGASLETALVGALHARVEWGAAVAVRNGVVSAYKTIINMPV